MSRTQTQWNSLFWRMLFPIVGLLILRLCIFPNTKLDTWVLGGIGTCFIVFILGKIKELNSFDVVFSNIVCYSFIILYLLHWTLGWFA